MKVGLISDIFSVTFLNFLLFALSIEIRWESCENLFSFDESLFGEIIEFKLCAATLLLNRRDCDPCCDDGLDKFDDRLLLSSIE